MTVIQYVFQETRKRNRNKEKIRQLCELLSSSSSIHIFLDTLFYRCYPYGIKDVILYEEIEVLKKILDMTTNEIETILTLLSTHKIIHVTGNTTVGLTPFGLEVYKYCFREDL
jgi:hypothetical protein